MVAILLPHLPDELASLQQLALDLRWTWSHEGDALWRDIDESLWDLTSSPWAVLQGTSAGRLENLRTDPQFLAKLKDFCEKRETYMQRPGWFAQSPERQKLGGVAYFSMEFGLGEALPLYAGGLGVLAGDFLKTASDLDLPMAGVGLLYQEGYFRQMISADGSQLEAFPYNEPATMPIEPVTDPQGGWMRIPIELPGRSVQLRVWQANVGRIKLYLLDSNHPLNSPVDRGITGKLYGGGGEMRLMQELMLGIGGWRLIERLRPEIEICHINEGHAAFAVLERACQLARAHNLSLEEAIWAGRPGNVFTTHTPMPAGFDRFEPDLLRRYLPSVQPFLAEEPNRLKEVIAMGQADPADASELFNMAYFAAHGSAYTCGVSKLHGGFSRRIFQPLFPRFPEAEVPIDHVTNGVHIPSWDSAEADRLWTQACGKERWRQMPDTLHRQIMGVSDEELWQLRSRGRRVAIQHARRRLVTQLRERGFGQQLLQQAQSVLDPNVLTLGFARRFTPYKRPNLLLWDKERFTRMLTDEHRPMQIIVAGKAHPADVLGKEMVREWIELAREPALRRHVIFLEDYHMGIAQILVQGVDVWINNPRRPWEACGTSGMKVLVNGGLNCSVRDGWWDEAYTAEVGWAVGEVDHHLVSNDEADAESLYELLETQIAPEFYARDAEGVPRRWIARIRESMAHLTPEFSATRMVRDYVEKAYLPCSASRQRRVADNCALARSLRAWSHNITQLWHSLHLGVPNVTRSEDGTWHFTVPVSLGDINPEDVQIEIYADPSGTLPGGAQVLRRERPIPGALNDFIYSGSVPSSRPPSDYTVRARPRHADAQLPQELPLILWQK
ncbi:MAG: alpha-glucan family phosphorylase [Alphaproteobacteria bacterium]|nr:alpha-glucan family phosphorylase [Alphaproteobacteria bacterium]